MMPSVSRPHPTIDSMPTFTTPMTARPFRRLCRAIGASLVVAALAFAPTAASAQTSADVYINEINYDTPGVDDIDSDERIQFVEIVAPAGFDTAGFSLVIYDVRGRVVSTLADGPMFAGAHRVTFDATSLPSGVYVYRLTTGSSVETGRITLVK